MNTRQTFIEAMNLMVDYKTIFMASPDFWNDIYDKLERGINDNPLYTAIYKTIKAVDQVQNDQKTLREINKAKERRFILEVIESRIAGDKVMVLSSTHQEKCYIESLFHNLFDQLQDQGAINLNTNFLNDGLIDFRMGNSHNLRDIRITSNGKFSLIGCSPDHRVFMSESLIRKAYMKPFEIYQNMIDRYDNGKTFSSFIKYSENLLLKQEQQEQCDAYKKSLSHSINWALGGQNAND
ncbi:hypothetical protein KTH44_16180 [Acinetobacter bereziniae]|uniref:hypothetical protein n=1 Tax=Acinetobacter bereziniae TaxID=106648 RepID=UPI0021CD50A1|nr:hypothetical protein [Acinetobacter bereziniae]MCU4320656.1 hypothetical protein [Acinetobacter bereziniae]